MVLVYDGGNNNMTSVTLSSLCLDWAKHHRTSYSSPFQSSMRLLLNEDLLGGGCLPCFILGWGPYVDISCLSHVYRLRITLEALSFCFSPHPFLAPLPPQAHTGPPAVVKQGCQVILNTAHHHGLSTKLHSPHPPPRCSHPPPDP